MFTRKENLIKLNFNGVEVLVDDPMEAAIGIDEINDSLKNDIKNNTKDGGEFAEAVMDLIDSFLVKLLGENFTDCMIAVFGEEKATYFDMIDLFNYIKGKYMEFAKSKETI